jgi:hypothetical protein
VNEEKLVDINIVWSNSRTNVNVELLLGSIAFFNQCHFTILCSSSSSSSSSSSHLMIMVLLGCLCWWTEGRCCTIEVNVAGLTETY